MSHPNRPMPRELPTPPLDRYDRLTGAVRNNRHVLDSLDRGDGSVTLNLGVGEYRFSQYLRLPDDTQPTLDLTIIDPRNKDGITSKFRHVTLRPIPTDPVRYARGQRYDAPTASGSAEEEVFLNFDDPTSPNTTVGSVTDGMIEGFTNTLKAMADAHAQVVIAHAM